MDLEGKEDAEDEEVAVGEQEPAAAQQPSSSSQPPQLTQSRAREEAGKKVSQHGKKLKYAAWALAVPGRISLAALQVAISRPLRRRVELEMALLKTHASCFELGQALHQGVDSHLIAEVWEAGVLARAPSPAALQ